MASFFVIERNLMMGTPRTGDKSALPFKTNDSFNSTMMASFLPVIVSKKNKQTNKEKYVFYCSVSQIHINPKKTRKKHQNDVFGRT